MATMYGMEISAEKSKVMVTSRKGEDTVDGNTTPHVKVGGECVEEVKSFQYLGSTISEDVTSTAKMKKRMAIAT